MQLSKLNKKTKKTKKKITSHKKKFWGSQTEKAIKLFQNGTEKIPIEFIHIYVIYKKCAAKVNYKLKLLSKQKMDIIVNICNKILKNEYNDQFPLHVWQSGGGTSTNMNVNEVIANIGNNIFKTNILHPNDDINLSQSTNDSFTSSVNIYIAINIKNKLIPNLLFFIKSLKKKMIEFKNIKKMGRTHLQDAIPITFGQEFSGYIHLLENSLTLIKQSLKNLYNLAAGGTAIGTGITTSHSFDKLICKELLKETNLPFVSAKNKFAEISSRNSILEFSNATKVLATNLLKIGQDMTLMSSGPIGGLNELIIPHNIAGSSIMSGKTNPSQCDALAMISIQVISNNMAITIANTKGNFELNIYNPLILHNISQSINLLSDICINFSKMFIKKIKVNKDHVKDVLNKSPSLSILLNKHIGYNKTTNLAKYALKKKITLKNANKKLNNYY